MSIILVCEIEIELLTQTETCCQRCPATFINKIAYILDRYIILISKEGVK